MSAAVEVARAELARARERYQRLSHPAAYPAWPAALALMDTIRPAEASICEEFRERWTAVMAARAALAAAKCNPNEVPNAQA